jgi:hypothetical protein
MSKSLIKLLYDALRQKHREMMNYAPNSPERFVLIQDARQIEMALTSGEVGAA